MPITVKLTDGRTATFPDGTSREEMAAALSSVPPLDAPKPVASHEPQTASSLTQGAINALPNIGGLIGSLAGGIPGAALGGAAGEGYRQLAQHATELPGAVVDVARGLLNHPAETLKGGAAGMGQGAVDAGVAGAIQGALDAAGTYLVQPVAKGVYGLALRPLKALRDKYGLKALIDAGFEGGILPTKGGAAKAMAQMAESKVAQRGMAEAYDQAGGAALRPITAAKTGLTPLVQQANAAQAATGTGADAAKTIISKAKSVIGTHPEGMSALQMLESKQAADAIADPAFAAARRTGGFVPPGSEAAIAKGWSKGYRSTLNAAVGPQFARQGLTTKTLYGLARAADYAAERPEAASNIMSLVGGAASSGGDVGKGLKNALLMRALLSPRMQAGTALLATPAFKYGTRALDTATGSHAEEALRAALLQSLMGNGEGAQ